MIRRLTVLLLIVGCSKEPINIETTLVERDGIFYTKDTNKPYSGPVFSLYEGGEKKSEGNIKDGKGDGKWTLWYENGQKKSEGKFEDDKKDGLWKDYYENGQLYLDRIYKDGKLEGLWKSYYNNGQLKYEWNYKEGELISQKCWDEDGSVKECLND